MRKWTDILEINQWEGIAVIIWFSMVFIATLLLLYRLLHGWIERHWIRKRLVILSIFSFISLVSGLLLNFGPTDVIILIIIVGIQTAMLNAVIYTQTDILRLFEPITGIKSRNIQCIKFCQIIVYIFTIVVPAIGTLICEKTGNEGGSTLLAFTILANIVICIVYEVWQELLYIFILRRYLKEQPHVSETRKKSFHSLIWLSVAMIFHDILAAVAFCFNIPALRVFTASISTHLLFVAQMYHLLVNVTFPKDIAEKKSNSTIHNESHISIVPIPMNIQVIVDRRSFEFHDRYETAQGPIFIESNFTE